jgi:hypothetical protein
LKLRRVQVLTGSASDMSRACGLVVADLLADRLTHGDQESVNEARRGARRRNIGTAGGWGYDRSDASVNIAPLVGVTLARLAAVLNKRPSNSGGRTHGRVVVM